jgi:hypothetical protein
VIAVGSRVIYAGKVGVVLNLGRSMAEDRLIAQVDFGARRILRVPVEQLKEVE